MRFEDTRETPKENNNNDILDFLLRRVMPQIAWK